MAHPADLVLDANYAGPFAADGEYFAPGIPLIAGQGLACRVMRGGRQAGLDIGGIDVRPSIDTDTLKVRVREVARPLRGGAFHLKEERAFYRIMAEPDCLDRHRREWTCESLRLSDIVIPPPFAAVTGRGVAGAPVRGVAISAASIGRGRAGAVSLLQILSAPVTGRGVAGAPARTVSLDAPATGRGRAFAALEAQGVILIDAAATGRGVAGTLTREAPLAALAIGQAVTGGVVRNVPVAAAASGAGAAGGVSRAILINAPATGRGVALPALQLDGAIEINSPATGRGVSGSVLREAFLAAVATGRGVSGALVRQSLLRAPATGRGVAEASLLRTGVVELDVTVTGRGVAGTLAREILIDALADGQGVTGAVQRVVALSASATGTGASGSLQRDVPLSAAATGSGASGQPVREVLLSAPATGTAAAPEALLREGVLADPAIGTGRAGAVLRSGQILGAARGRGVAGSVVGEDGPGVSTRTAPVFRSASSATVSTTIARPAGVVAGDLIIGMFVDYESTTATITAPSGWTAIGSILRGSSGGASILMQLAYRVATGSEPTSYSWGTTSGDYPCAILAAYQSCDVSNPVAAIQSATGAGTARQQPAATAANDNSARIGISAGYGSSATTPSGMTSRATSNAGINGHYDLIPVSAGALSAISHGTDFLWIGATVVINGAPG